MTWLFSFFSSRRLLLAVTAVAATVSALPVAAQSTVQKAADEQAETNVSAEQMTGRPDREVVLERDVEIVRGGTTVNSDHATYWRSLYR
jgi:LPS-assembly protein